MRIVVQLTEFLTKMRRNVVTVCCENGEDRAKLIQFLLDNGFRHGNSEWSRLLLAHHDADTKRGYHWSVVRISCGKNIEFRSETGLSDIPYDRIAYLIEPPVDIDDLV